MDTTLTFYWIVGIAITSIMFAVRDKNQLVMGLVGRFRGEYSPINGDNGSSAKIAKRKVITSDYQRDLASSIPPAR